MKQYAILLDTTYCTGCNTCAYRCIQEFRYHGQAAKGLFRTFVTDNDDGLYHKRCMHCIKPECVKNCPVKALAKTEYGPVLYSAETCIGCRTCTKACPFHVPLFDEATKKIVKCSFCAHKVGKGTQPSCVEACPTGALQFGEVDAMLAKARNISQKGRLAVYGMLEAGGTNLLVLFKGDPVKAGYPAVKKAAARAKLAAAGQEIPLPAVAVAAVVGLNKLAERKDRVAKEEKK